MDKDRSQRNRLLFAGMGSALAVHTWYYFPFLSDDALISLRYARRLANGLGLTWTAGERVEGYTYLGWVLIHGVSSALGFDPIASARTVGFAGALTAIMAVSMVPRTLQLSGRRLLTGGATLALTPPLAVWAMGGLEQGFMAGLLALGLLLLNRLLERERPPSGEVWQTGLVFALLALMRADGIVLFGLAALGVLLSRGHQQASWRLVAKLAALPASFVLGQLLFRIGYYGELVPNTALVKISLTPARLRNGLDHVKQGALALNVLWLGVLVSLGACLRHAARHRYVVPLTVTVGWWGYVASVGGDIFPGWRQMLLGIVPLAMLVAEGATHLKLRRRRTRWAMGGVLLAMLVSYPALQTLDPENQRAKKELWEWDGYGLGRLLKRAFGHHRPLLAVDAAGALPYWSELPALDMLGLNDKYIATHRPKGFGRGPLGHDLGDGAYVWRRRPDIIAFRNACGAEEAVFLGGRQLVANRDFPAQYHLVRARGDRGNGAVGIFYIRHEGGPLGIERSDAAVSIPGYLLSATIPSGAELGPGDRLVTPVSARHPGRVSRVRLDPGTWELSLEPSVPQAVIGWRCRRNLRSDGELPRPLRTPSRPALRLEHKGFVDIIVAMPIGHDDSVRLERVVLTRTDTAGTTQSCSFPHGYVEATLSDVADPKPDGTSHDHPDNLRFRATGLRVNLPEPRFPTRLELSVDRNDSYRIRYERRGELVDVSGIEPRPEGAGLAVHRITVPRDVQAQGIDRIVIVPRQGAGNHSLGHLRLYE